MLINLFIIACVFACGFLAGVIACLRVASRDEGANPQDYQHD
jgi:hypothetical protein